VQLERGRMQQVMTGYDRGDKDSLRGMAYVSFQELATRISHRNTGRFSQDPVADRIMVRIATDENLHMIFYRDMLEAALRLDPSAGVKAISAEVLGFEMPGAGMTDFNSKAVQIAKAGIYDLRVHHDEVLWPLLRHWNFFDIEGLDDEAEKSRTQVSEFLAALDDMAAKYDAKREERQARELATA
jgi:acyl-[acyl-carrier-protein] desaturase